MPRGPRTYAQSGCYHIMMRGVNRQKIYHDNADYMRFSSVLQKAVWEDRVELMGYCIMSNHCHLLVYDPQGNLSSFMQRIGTSYAGFYNNKYGHCGHVFQNRFRSEPVEDEYYLITLINYIHRNPVEAGIVDRPEQYRWSSCRNYYEPANNVYSPVSVHKILALFGSGQDQAIECFRRFMNDKTDIKPDIENEIWKYSVREAQKIMETALNGTRVSKVREMNRADRDAALKTLKSIPGMSMRQIARMVGMSYTAVYMAD